MSYISKLVFVPLVLSLWIHKFATSQIVSNWHSESFFKLTFSERVKPDLLCFKKVSEAYKYVFIIIYWL